jgi:class 3 adenylate cyclase/tetratricopeptide (TPR) repeat protein
MITCPSCGRETPEGFPRCAHCGAELAPAETAREERKVVTVLFCDLVGSTAAAEQQDPEDVRARLSHYNEHVRSELQHFGGTVEKFIGDAVMALFGAPTAHEDDPERAVRAALAIRDWARDEGELEVRIGITTGEALVSVGARPEAGEGMASGDVVNTGARLQTAAPTNGVLVDETTYRATERAIDYREATPVEAKGKSRRVPVWEAVEVRWRLGVDVEQQGPAELVGRTEELDLLTDALVRARRERASQLVTLVGVPGIGKSRLVYELGRVVDADPDLIWWRQGRSLPYGEGVTFWALAEMVKSHAGILETDPAEAAEVKLRDVVSELLADPVDVDWALGHLHPLVGLGGQPEIGGERRAEVFAAWRKFFEALAERRPLILVFEDLQWADDGLLDFVDHLVEWASGVPLLCVCTARPELLERRPGWGGGKRNATTISLSPLSEVDTSRLVAALLERAVLPADVQSLLLAHAGGNPLYAEEYVRMLQDRGLDHIAETRLPESVQGIIAARLDALPVEEKDLLQDGAVMGKVVWVGALAEITGLPRWTVEERLHALERKEFVRREQHSSVGGETEYAFRHILVRDVAYGQIPRARRAGKHRAAAGWIESLVAGRRDENAELLAHHYLQALEYANAAGEDTSEFADRAREALREAGDRAVLLAAPSGAMRFYEGALELTPADDPGRGELLLRAGEARWYATGVRNDVLLEARDALLASGEKGLAAEAETLLAVAFWYEGDRSTAEEHLSAAETLVRDLPPSLSKARVLSYVARFNMLAGKSDVALDAGSRALEMARALQSAPLEASALNSLGTARANLGDPAGIEDLERASATAARAKNLEEHSRALLNLGVVFGVRGELARERELYEEAGEVARKGGIVIGMRWSEGNLLKSHYWAGRWEEALALARPFVTETGGDTAHYMAVQAHYFRAAIRLARGAEGAAEDTERALEFAQGAQDPQAVYPAGRFGIYVFWALGDTARARELLAAQVEAPPHNVMGGLPQVGLVEAAWFAGTVGLGSRFLERFTGPVSTPWFEAAEAIVSGDPVRAAEILEEIGALPEAAFTRLRSAEPGEVERALDFYRSVDAARYVREAEELLATSRSA